MYKDNETLALELSNNRTALLNQLNEAKQIFGVSKYFKNPIFDFENKRLIGTDGIILQWKLRRNPKLPESYLNQQTSCGIIQCYQLEKTVITA